MHRALHIHEVLQVIFENFLPVHDDRSLTFASYESYASFVAGKSTSQTLLSLAVTCRTFLEPALDALWWAMDDLTPLLALLNGYKNIMDGHEDRIKVISGYISDSECEKLFSYAKRIKLYYCHRSHRILIHSYLQILHATGRSSILPSLKYLLCTASCPELLCLLTPSLRVLNVNITQKSEREYYTIENLRAFISCLPRQTPDLIGIRIEAHISQECLEPIFNASGPNLRYLRLDNDLYYDDATCWDSISITSPSVKSLSSLATNLSHLHLGRGIDFLYEKRAMSPCMFTALEKLEIEVEGVKNFKGLMNFFRMACLPVLKHMKLASYCPEDSNCSAQNWDDLMKILVRATTTNFTSLQIFWTWEDEFSLTLNEIPQILGFRLTSFGTDILKSVTCADIRTMAGIWSHLNELDLSTSMDFPELVEIARSFPHMRQLAVSLTEKLPPSFSKIPVLKHPLRELRLSSYYGLKGQDHHVINIAHCIDRLFPALDALIYSALSDAEARPWDEVKRILKAFQVARKDEVTRESEDGGVDVQLS